MELKNMQLKNNLKEIRKEKNLSQQQLADMIGVARNTICSIERGEYSPRASLALLICYALEKQFAEVFYLIDTKKE